MNTPKLRALLSAIEPDGTVVVRIDSKGKITPVESLPAATRRMDAAFGLCLYKAGEAVLSIDELDDMVEMSMYAVRWLHDCCLQLGLEVL